MLSALLKANRLTEATTAPKAKPIDELEIFKTIEF